MSVATRLGRIETRTWVAVITFLVYFIENVLLTVVVPVVPDYLEDAVEAGGGSVSGAEFGRIGALFAAKSLSQLVANPVAAWATRRIRNDYLICAGNLVFFASAITFAAGESYAAFFLARSMHGVGSALAIIAGLALLSETFVEDVERSRVMGFSLGGMAVGVLVGYPSGGFLYTYVGKSAPFILTAVFCVLLGIILLFAMPLSPELSRKNAKDEMETVDYSRLGKKAQNKTMMELLRNPTVAICIGSIGVSTTAIATLEPCLPLWLRQNIQPEEWQIGTAFLPDSLGYLVGTNVFGSVAPRVGRWVCALGSHAAVCASAFCLPFATSMTHLILPHFGIGLGIATIDASLMPLLASAAEADVAGGEGSYGAVFALYQTTVCLAYGLGPFLGGWLMVAIDFTWLMRLISLMNLLFIPFILKLRALESRSKAAGYEEISSDQPIDPTHSSPVQAHAYGTSPLTR